MSKVESGSAAPPKPRRKRNREILVKDILPDGTIVDMSKKESAKRRKSIKTIIRNEQASDDKR